jgi:hypothetical protein
MGVSKVAEIETARGEFAARFRGLVETLMAALNMFALAS